MRRTFSNFPWHDCTSLTNTPRRTIPPATFNARRLKLRNFFLPWIHGFFFSFFTGRVLRLKLIRLNRHRDRFRRSRSEDCCLKTAVLRPGRQGEQPYYVMTPEGHSPQRKWWTRELHRPLFWTAQKAVKGNEDFSVRKISFWDRILKSI